MKRISNLFLALVLVASTAALAQDSMNKTMTGRVISSSAYELVVQNDAGTRMNLVLDSSTSKPAILEAGDTVTVVYKPLDTGGYQAIQVLEGTSANAAPKAAGTTTRTLTNTAPTGTAGQTGESRTTVIGTTGGYQAPAHPAQPNDPNRDLSAKSMEPMNDTMGEKPMADTSATMNDPMAKRPMDPMDNDTMANDKMAQTPTATDTSYDETLPRTASPAPAVFVFGLLALGAAALLMRRRTSH